MIIPVNLIETVERHRYAGEGFADSAVPATMTALLINHAIRY